MVVQRNDLACCVRCAGTANGDRLARRPLLKAAVHPPTAPAPAFPGPRAPAGPAGFPGHAADHGAAGHQQPAGWPAVVSGTVLDASPQVITLYADDGTTRLAMTPDTSVWKGTRADLTAMEAGDSVVIRCHPRPRGVADRIWVNAGRVTGVIVDRYRDGVLVDEGRTTSQQAVVIPGRAASRLQVRFPRLDPGYLIDVIGLRGRGYLEALIPATSQPTYRADEAPAPAPVRSHVADSIAGSATWHEPAGPADADGLRYPALDPDTGCLEQPLYGSACPQLPYLSVGSLLRVRNECTGMSRVLPVSGCAAMAQVFCDRCVTCGTSPRGRIADLPMASFVAMGGELDQGCFNATVSMGQP